MKYLVKIYNKLIRMLSIKSDEKFIKYLFKFNLGYKLNLNNPKTFNEKLQWLKLNDRNPEYTHLVDKYEVKKIIEKELGVEYVVPTIGVWNEIEEINFDELPDKFVIKCTHDSGGVIICNDKKNIEIKKIKKFFKKRMNKNHYYACREWPYKDIKPRIIVEKYLCQDSSQSIKDYKFFCFNGKVKCFKIDVDRFTNHRANYYDLNMNILKIGESDFPPDFDKNLEMPKNFGKMVELSEKIAMKIPFVRVDFYEIDLNIFIGEITLYPAGGFGKFIDVENDFLLGSWLNLNK